MAGQDQALAEACTEITRSLLSVRGPDGGRVREVIRRVCAKHSLGRIPANHEILSAAGRREGPDFQRLRGLLLKKPAKTASGVAVVALMPKPYACPHGRCTYCPGGIASNSPNSYTGREPPTLQAIRSGYDPALQITSKIDRLAAFGHDTSKMELVIVGGTFLFMPLAYQESFIKSCYDALNGTPSADLREAQSNNERAAIRNVGLTVETKPDYCKEGHVDLMLRYGVTRVEIGVQSLRDRVYRAVNRGHDFGDVTESFRVSKDAGYKIAAHMMPGLPTMTPDEDIADFGRLFSDPELRPDMLKIYPSLVIRGTPLYDDYVRGRYVPYSDGEMMRVLAEAKRAVPKWVRIMRIQREISPGEIVAGPRSGNLRQMVREELARRGESCRCIRCREVGLSGHARRPGPAAPRGTDDLRLERIDYESSGGDEAFLSYEDRAGRIYGFLRLRRPGHTAHRREVAGGGSCIVRELHVYGRSLGVGRRQQRQQRQQDASQVQHLGLGRALMGEAERIAAEEFDARGLLVISAVGTRQYYRRLGYSLYGPYMHKGLA